MADSAPSKADRWLVPGLPLLVSLALSAVTVGTHVFWQDSGLYLAAVKDLGVLYPPGFVVYELLCKLWTVALAFVDFTLAVHLFSALCAALAAATLAVATRDLLRTRGPLFKVTEVDPGPMAAAVGAVVGVLAASGFTFWFAGIYAKGYSLWYLVLAQLLWWMIRADASGRPRDFTVVSALIGLSWAVHPSSALLGAALLLFVTHHRAAVGPRGLAWRVGLAAACAAGPTLLVLPILAARSPEVVLGDPTSIPELFRYLVGSRFVGVHDVFGFDASRGASFGQYLWEEMLGVGLVLVTMGLARLVSLNRRLLVGLAAWTVPHAFVTILFKFEGQHDCWFVASWLPLYLAMGVGLHDVALRAGRRAMAVAAGLGIAGLAWAALVNRPLLEQRTYDLAETFGRVHLQNLDPDAILILSTDDPMATCQYLQTVRGYRRDVLIVQGSALGAGVEGSAGWYVRRLLARHPFLRSPDPASLGASWDGQAESWIAAFINANVQGGRPIFSESQPPAQKIREGYALAPAGALWKVVAKSGEAVQEQYWEFPTTAEEAGRRFRRERGQLVRVTPDEVRVAPQSYEARLFLLLIKAREMRGDAYMRAGRFDLGKEAFEEVLRIDPAAADRVEVVYALAICNHATGKEDAAQELFQRVLKLRSDPRTRSVAFLKLGEIHRSRGQKEEAKRCFMQALTVPGLDDSARREIERQLRPK